MILDELVLHDFGVYGGHQSVTLTPEAERPIILFGGLNGGGKTTLLDGLQLCLYGAAAKVSNRGGLSYEEYLRRSVHRQALQPEARVELAFRHRNDDREQALRLIRSWTAAPAGIRERFEVIRDGEVDILATEHWTEQVEEVMPTRIAPLFLFDGEKIESYADLSGASTLIATAVQNLLGLDVVDRLISDLVQLERRKRASIRTSGDRSAIAGVRARLSRAKTERAAFVQERSSTQNLIDRARESVERAEADYRREGGALFEERAGNEEKRVRAREQLNAKQREQREMAAGVAPLLLISGLLDRTSRRDRVEEEVRRSRETLAVLETEFEMLGALPAFAELPAKARRSLTAHLAARLDKRAALAREPILLDLARDTRDVLTAAIEGEMPGALFMIRRLAMDEDKSRKELDAVEAALAATPSADALADAAQTLAQAEASLAGYESAKRDFDTAIARLEREIAALQTEEERLIAEEAARELAQDDTARMIRHADRSRATLKRFHQAVAERHVHRIEGLVLDCFAQLIRKPRLITGFRIDPKDFAVELKGGDGQVLTPERLSAGERQLLAVAILWGLARASGRPLPMVIDTPLGRLDSDHRSHLIQRYFPHASHQLLLLSTDEEITGRYLEEIRPWVARTYCLRHDEATQRTMIMPGYLEETALVA